MKKRSGGSRLRLALILSLPLAAVRGASAASLCGDGEVLGKMSLGENQLIACGIKDGTTASDLKIYGLHGEEKTTLFRGDDAFKTYRFETGKDGFHIKEALSDSRRFRPFIEIVVSCDKDRCSESDAKCLWKKQPAQDGAMKKIAAAAKSNRCDGLDVLVDKAYLAMLNGDNKAVDFFEKDVVPECMSGDAAAGEAYLTYRDDVKRLRRVGCIPASSN